MYITYCTCNFLVLIHVSCPSTIWLLPIREPQEVFFILWTHVCVFSCWICAVLNIKAFVQAHPQTGGSEVIRSWICLSLRVLMMIHGFTPPLYLFIFHLFHYEIMIIILNAQAFLWALTDLTDLLKQTRVNTEIILWLILGTYINVVELFTHHTCYICYIQITKDHINQGCHLLV